MSKRKNDFDSAAHLAGLLALGARTVATIPARVAVVSARLPADGVQVFPTRWAAWAAFPDEAVVVVIDGLAALTDD